MLSCGLDSRVVSTPARCVLRSLFNEQLLKLTARRDLCSPGALLQLLQWHARHGLLQDAGLLQHVLVAAARQGDVELLEGVLLLLKERGWQAHLGSISRQAPAHIVAPLPHLHRPCI